MHAKALFNVQRPIHHDVIGVAPVRNQECLLNRLIDDQLTFYQLIVNLFSQPDNHPCGVILQPTSRTRNVVSNLGSGSWLEMSMG